jgi:hypothetical protein
MVFRPAAAGCTLDGMVGATYRRIAGTCMVVGGLLALGCNIALPHDDDDFRFVEEIGRSNSWPWLHAGLFVGVLLLLVGLHALVQEVRAERPELASLATGALLVGGTLMLAALAVAGSAQRKAADNMLFVGRGPDLSGSFFSALGFDRLAYALFAAASVTLLGTVPLATGAALLRRVPALGITGLIAGALGVVTGLVQLVAEVDTFALYLVTSVCVTLWAMAAGAWLVRGQGSS